MKYLIHSLGIRTSIPYDAIDEEVGESSHQMTRKRTTVSCREYYVYKLQIRDEDKSYPLRFGRLLQQYVIDNYVKLESTRLDFLTNNHKKLRQEHYKGVVDSVAYGIELAGYIHRWS